MRARVGVVRGWLLGGLFVFLSEAAVIVASIGLALGVAAIVLALR